jgi:arsenite methyltransferase
MSGPTDERKIQDAVREKYAEVSRAASGKFNYPTGREGAVRQGYDPIIIQSIPDEVIESFCGVGNPFKLGAVKPGESVLDVGCGSGFDLIVASRMMGGLGNAYGIDLTPEMAEKAKGNLNRCGVQNYDIQVAGAESIPYPDNTFDVIISNGVLNLSPLKETCFREIYRVLRPDGRLQFADIVLKQDCGGAMCSTLDAWSS